MDRDKTCCFFGHRRIYDREDQLFEYVITELESLIKEQCFNEFLFGGYGEFDSLCHKAVNKLKAIHPELKTVYVQAYYKPKDENFQYLRDRYDEVIYPELEEKPQKFAINYRNREMIDGSDFCIFYVKNDYGGAFQAMQYAKRKKKALRNLAERVPNR